MIGPNFTTLKQCTWKERLLLVPGLVLQRLKETVPQAYFDRKMIFDDLILKGNSISREGMANVLTVRQDKDLGDYSVLLRRYGSDYGVFYQVLQQKQYAPLVDLLHQYVPGHSVRYVIDAGGNIGLSSLFFARQFPNAQIITLEPDQDNMRSLLRNLALNKLEKVIPLQVGLWHVNEQLVLDRSTGDQEAWAFSVKKAVQQPRPGTDTIAGVTIDHLLEQHGWPGIDVLKIDIEGAEHEIFNDKAQVKRMLSRVKFLAIEIHGPEDVKENMVRQIEESGFSCFHSGELTIGVNKSALGAF